MQNLEVGAAWVSLPSITCQRPHSSTDPCWVAPHTTDRDHSNIDRTEPKVSARTSLWTGKVQTGTACLSEQQKYQIWNRWRVQSVEHQYSSFFFKMLLSIYFTQLNISHLAQRCYFCLWSTQHSNLHHPVLCFSNKVLWYLPPCPWQLWATSLSS